MDESELDYLSSDFDPSSVTAPRLRSILLAQDVHYPSNAKKPELVELFRQEVAPKAEKLLKKRSRIKPTTRGITDAPPSQTASVVDEDDIANTVEETPRRTSRKTADASTSKSAGGRASAKKKSSTTPGSRATTAERHGSRLSDVDSDASTRSTTKRRTRHSIDEPVIKEEDEDISALDRVDEESPFSSDNPFQSGSSPIAAVLDGADDGDRRRTTGLAREQKKTPTNRRKTDPATSTSRASQKRSRPVKEPSLSPSPETESDNLTTGEEFTSEEEAELEEEMAQTGETDLLPARKRKRPRTSGPLRTAPWAILLAMAGGIATVWRQEKVNVGYCGVGRPSVSIGGVEIPEWASIVRPECEQCPQHAYCYSRMETTCEPGFVLEQHPLSLGGAIPLPPTCEPDGEKARKVKAVADRAIGELRERNAQAECGELRDEEGRLIRQPDIEEILLKSKVASKRRKGMSQEEFEDLWQAAIGEILSRDEVSSGVDGTSGGRSIRSNSLARLPFSCAVRRSVRLSLARHLWKLIGVITIIVAAIYARFSITSGRKTEATAKHLASLTLDRLATQAALHAQEPSRMPEAWISMSQLRDDVLRNEFSSKRRQKLWEKVQKKVEGNSNVRSMVREGRSGEVSRVWEWIGAINRVEDMWSPEKRHEPGYMGTSARSTPVGEKKGRPDGQMVERRRAEEDRAYY